MGGRGAISGAPAAARGAAARAANPLLAAWLKYGRAFDRELREMLSGRGSAIYGGAAPLSLGDVLRRPHMRESRMRRKACARWSFAVPSDEALDALAALSPLVEAGAGTGYWARLLAGRGADVVAYDTRPPGHRQHQFVRGHFAVCAGDGPAVARRHADRTLFLCWPPNWNEMASETLAAYGGRTVAYAGEHAGGCCATDTFFAALEAGWEEAACVDLPQWHGMHDALWIYRRKA